MTTEEGFLRQAAAIPVRDGRVCLVTSSNGKRWVIPKGIIDPGQTAGECALNEAWEEAGLAGFLYGEPIGSYTYQKWGCTCHVTVFLLHVTEEAQRWPEQDLRQREWVTPSEALQRITDEGLLRVVQHGLRQHRRGDKS